MALDIPMFYTAEWVTLHFPIDARVPLRVSMTLDHAYKVKRQIYPMCNLPNVYTKVSNYK